jgi:hypothetical protein
MVSVVTKDVFTVYQTSTPVEECLIEGEEEEWVRGLGRLLSLRNWSLTYACGNPSREQYMTTKNPLNPSIITVMQVVLVFNRKDKIKTKRLVKTQTLSSIT